MIFKLPSDYKTEADFDSYIFSKYTSGVSLRELANLTKISRPTIHKRLERLGASFRNIPSKKIGEDVQLKILELAKSKKTVEQIANECNINPGQVTYLLRKENIYNRFIDRKFSTIDIARFNGRFNTLEDLYTHVINEYKTKTSQEIANDLGWKAHHSVISILKKFGIPRRPQQARQICFVDDDYFEVIDTWEKAYILGFIYADGCIYISSSTPCLALNVAIKDRDHLQTITSKLHSTYKISDRLQSSTFSGTVLPKPRWISGTHIYSRKLTNDLMDKGVVPRKSLILQWPRKVPDELMRGFILGFIDGDGWWTVYKDARQSYRPALGVCSGSYQFLEKLAKYLNDTLHVKLAIINTRERNNSKNYQIVYASILDCIKLFDYLYMDASIYLERKRNKVESILENLRSAYANSL